MTFQHRHVLAWAILALTVVAIGWLALPFAKTALIAHQLFNLARGDIQGIPFALDSLRSENAIIRRAAARGLGQIGPQAKKAAPDLLAAVENDCWQVASEAAWSLGQIESPERQIIDGLISAMEHEHGEVRRYAAYSLAGYGPRSRSAVPKLIERLGDEHMGYMAAHALGVIGSDARSAIPRLTQLLESSNAGERAEAALALSKLSPVPRDTVAAIQGLSADPEELVRDAAQKSLQSIHAKQVASNGQRLAP